MTPFELATRDLLEVIADALQDIWCTDTTSQDLRALALIYTQGLARDLTIDEGFPDLPDAPLRDVRHCTDIMRDRLAGIKAGTEEAEEGAPHGLPRTLPGHPVKEGAGYDCNCGACLSLPARRRDRRRECPCGEGPAGDCPGTWHGCDFHDEGEEPS